MGYLYENSNPERFQQLCQSLLTSDFPQLQCYPVGQPDGGRDGWDPDSKSVLQVKFKRADDEENASWMIATLERELPKILRLAERGAKKYIMATNARGTAHELVGSIDKVQTWLDEKLPIPGICLWRDELDRRFDSASFSLKLKYSEIISLEDGIELVLNTTSGPDRIRQEDAVRAFLVNQYEADKAVKFKQVSLSNDLLDLFIDVPVGLPSKVLEKLNRGTSGGDISAFFSALNGSMLHSYFDGDGDSNELLMEGGTRAFRQLNLGAAEMLLGIAAQEHLKLVVLEGGPGQGKSTLAQYVCQIHRARYLQKQEVLARVTDTYRQTAFRVPIKVDLRDYAAFLEGSSPFANESSPSEPRTLDVFLGQLIGYASGGINFSAHDLLSLLKNAPTLVFLDGLDEVADISAREFLVESVGEAISRWRAFDADIQVVVTSRPSVFGRAPSLGKFGFTTLALQNIDSDRIDEYANRWVAARGLNELEKGDVKKILGEKLELAHIRDLTRNPMQLTILLSLIHQFGHSLPDQRTDLYSRYVDLFLTREADKSARVRDNRAVLLDFIGHLAWVLQTQAESSNSAGSVSAQDLQEMARDFLRAGGHDVAIAEDLFGGGLERIFVLVERIEGLYEFEVQPLREYYCAQHLYSTAPVGTYRGEAIRGDRAQRFEALAANPFWLNVCRFYAGSCQRGEIGTLVFSLEELIKTGDLAVAIHARRVGLSLLQDWVFSNSKFAQDQLIEAILDDNGVDILVSIDGRLNDELSLNLECGQAKLRESVFNTLQEFPVDVRTAALCHVLKKNGGAHLGQAFRDLLIDQAGEDRTYQLIRMFRAGACASLAPEDIWQLITKDNPGARQLLLRSSELLLNEPSIATRIPRLVEVFVQGVLDGLIRGAGLNLSSLAVFANILGNSASAFMQVRPVFYPAVIEGENSRLIGSATIPAGVRNFIESVGRIVDGSTDGADGFGDQWRSPELWSQIAELARDEFGDTWATMSIAIRMAAFKTATGLPEGSSRLFDAEIPVCARARAARLRRGGTRWWLEQLDHASSPQDRRLWAGLVLMWSSVKNLCELSDEVNAIVESLNDFEYNSLKLTIASASSSRNLRADRKKLTEVYLDSFSSRVAVLVAIAFNAEYSSLVYSARHGQEEPLRAFLCQKRDAQRIDDLPGRGNQEQALEWAQLVASLGQRREAPSYRAYRHLHRFPLRVESAKEVLNRPREFPWEIVSRAALEVQIRYRPNTLANLATEQDWIFE